jgi:ADP-heptose:LPS heptosyltransferase
MNLHESVEGRIHDLRSKLEIIDHAMSEEMAKVYKKRRGSLLRFLYLEREVYLLAVKELETLGQGEKRRRTEKKFPIYDQLRVIDYTEAELKKSKNAAGVKRIHRIVTWGGIGDALLMTPAIRMLKKQDPTCKIHVYCERKPHKEILKNNPNIDRLIFVGGWGKNILQLISERKLLTFRWANYSLLGLNLLYNNNAAEIMGEKLGVGIDSTHLDCFVTEEEEMEARKTLARYPNPVIIQINSRSSPNKHWPIDNWGKLVLNNPQYDFLQVGLSNEQLVQGAADLRGKTTLRQSLGIVKVAKAFVGVDSGLAHVAAAFKTPAVVLFGASSPTVFGHTANKNLYHPPRCSPCMDILGMISCPYGAPCMSSITVSEVERALSLLVTLETS